MNDVVVDTPVTPEVTTETAAPTESWYGGFENESLRGIPEIKGWDSPETAVESYHNLEKLHKCFPRYNQFLDIHLHHVCLFSILSLPIDLNFI